MKFFLQAKMILKNLKESQNSSLVNNYKTNQNNDKFVELKIDPSTLLKTNGSSTDNGPS
jgi:hypothetical protein